MEQLYRENNTAWSEAVNKVSEFIEALSFAKEVFEEYLGKYEELFPDHAVDEYMRRHKHKKLLGGLDMIDSAFKPQVKRLLELVCKTASVLEKHQTRFTIMCHSTLVLKGIADNIRYYAEDLQEDCTVELEDCLSRDRSTIGLNFHAWIVKEARYLRNHYDKMTDVMEAFGDYFRHLVHALNSFEEI
jgi:hypothetical protein